jgi:Histidine kinase-, DNA gyrase B-, and HSP90-like ATPase
LSVVATGHGLPVRILVADAGQGIPAELLGDIFDRFRSGDAGHPRGTGLGLALVRAVARAHGGEVLVSSHPGQGSEFELRLPRAAEPQAPPPQALPPEVPAAAGGRLARKSLRRGGVHREAHGGAPGSRAADNRAVTGRTG